jgi:hypothetical protein
MNMKNLKWNTRQRLSYIETKAYYTGSVSRSDVAQTFAMSDPAATKDLKLYNDLSPGNLIYKQSEFGFVPAPGFVQTFSDLNPALVLSSVSQNHPSPWLAAENGSIFGLSALTLPYPTRLPDKAIVAQLTRAMHQSKNLKILYASLHNREHDQHRIIEPHSLVNTGLRWHVRAYNEQQFDFRDFVLSRILEAKLIEEPAESSADHDEDWMETLTLEMAPHPGLTPRQLLNLHVDFSDDGKTIRLTVRRALLGYALRSLSVDTTMGHTLDPNAYQLVLLNREEIEIYAGWALM